MKRRQFNARLFLWLVAIGVVLTPCGYYLHAYQVKRTANFLLLQARTAKDSGDLSKSVSYFGRYLALMPKAADASADFALLLANDKIAKTPRGLERAYYALAQTLRLDAQRHDVRRRAIEVAMHGWLQRFNDAGDHIDWFLQQDIVDAELLRWRGQCHEVAGDFKPARKEYERALALPTRSEEDFVRLAFLLRREPLKARAKENTDEAMFQIADQKIEEMLAAFKDSYRACLLSAGYRRATLLSKDTDEKTRTRIAELIALDIERAVALAPTEAEVMLAAADLRLEESKTSEARQFLEDGIKLHKGDWRMYQALARVEIAEKKPGAAVDTLQRGLEELPKQIDLIWNLAHLYLQENQNAEAEILIGKLAAEGFPQRELDYLQGRLLVNKEEWITAVRLLQRTIPQLQGRFDRPKELFAFNLAQECNFLLARCFERMGDPDQAAATYALIVARDPNSTGGRFGLARMEWAMGLSESALGEYRKLLQLPQAPAAALVECAHLLIARNQKMVNANWTEVEKLLDFAAKVQPPMTVEVAILRAEVLATQKKYDQARGLLTKQFESAKDRPVAVWVSLSLLEQRRDRPEEAHVVLKEAERLLGDRLELRIARARFWSRQGGSETARLLTTLYKGVETWPPANQRRLQEELARAFSRIGEITLAEAAWRKIAERHPNDVGSRMALFDLAMAANNEPAMGNCVEDLKRVEGDEGSLWRYCQACRLTWLAQKANNDKKLLAEANTLLTVVAGRRPAWHRVPVAQAHVDRLLDKRDAAIARYREAIAMGNQDPAVIRQVVLLLYGDKRRSLRYQELGDMLQMLRDQTGRLGDLTKVAAEVALAKHDTGMALNLAQNSVSAQSKDFRDHIWLGYVLWAADKKPEAEMAFRTATDLNKENPDPWIALVQFFQNMGEKAKVEAVILEIHKNVPRAQALLPLGFSYMLIGQVEKAQEMYDAALNAKPEDIAVLQAAALFQLSRGNREQAQLHLEKILQLKSGSANEIADARRVLALVLASSGNYQQTQKALSMIGVLDDADRADDLAPEPNVADERAKAVILARQRSPRDRRKAIAILEALGRQTRTGDEQFLLAQLYESVKEWPKAKAQFQELLSDTQLSLAKGGPNQDRIKTALGTYIATYCLSLLRHDVNTEAEGWLARLEKLEPNSFRTVAIKAQWLGKQGRGKEAVPVLIAVADKTPDLVQAVAVLLEEIAENEEAEKMLQRFVDQNRAKAPESVLVLADFLARRNRPDEALAICETAWKDCKPHAVAQACVAVLFKSKSNEVHWRKVVGWLERESAKRPSDSSFLENLSAVRVLSKDYESAIALCRRIVELNKTDGITKNNLAWMLALHKKEHTEAFKLIEQAIELQGPTPALLDTRAVIFMKLGKADKAIRDLEDVVGESPTASRYFHLAQAHLMANNRVAAVSAFQRGKELNLNEGTVDPLELAEYLQVRRQLEGTK